MTFDELVRKVTVRTKPGASLAVIVSSTVAELGFAVNEATGALDSLLVNSTVGDERDRAWTPPAQRNVRFRGARRKR